MPFDQEPQAFAEQVDLHEPVRGPGWAVLWGCFLGCSWTWVIGMVFPVLLLRDYGIWGWVAFAVPNVIGAAAMGFVLTTPDVARLIWSRHRTMVRWFSDVTLAYHVFVLMWLGTKLFGPAALAAAAIPLMMMVPARRKAWGPWLPVAAAAVALLSWGCFSYAVRLPEAGVIIDDLFGMATPTPALGAPDLPAPRLGLTDFLIFVPAAITGFLCCPYLDGTFLRARAATSRGTGRFAFTFGFGIVFFSMIVFSLAYAAWLIPAFEAGHRDGIAWPNVWAVVIGIHMLVQVALTMTLHLREREFLNPDGRQLGPLTLMLVIAFGLVLLQRLHDGVLGSSWAEIGYRSFLLMYGLTFPAYVWLVMLRRGAITRAAWVRFGVTSAIAAPMGFVGFVTGPAWWLLGALVVVTLAKLVPIGIDRAKPDEVLA
ncbi:MAG: hypothetical protein AAGJ38_02170 [Planctomycetota bacterium]